jgi:hypothetical protein
MTSHPDTEKRFYHNLIWNSLRLNAEYHKQINIKNNQKIRKQFEIKISKMNLILYSNFYLFNIINIKKLPPYIRQIILNYFDNDLKKVYSTKMEETDNEIQFLFHQHQLKLLNKK